MITTAQMQGIVASLQHTSRVLENNPAGDRSVRDLYVYLPPDYDHDRDRRYPVVYLLTGFTGRGKMMLNDSAFSPNIAERLNKLIAEETIGPMIVVMPDCFTYYGGSQYINSGATGRYEDYLTEEIVPFVDQNFRTIPGRNSRAVAGKSSGGYGAMVLAMRHSDLFGLAASISGDCYFELCYKPDFKNAFRAIKGDPLALLKKFWDEETPKAKTDFDGLNIICMSACYSPNPGSDWGFDLPFDPETGEIRVEVWDKWQRHDPIRLAEQYAEQLRSLRLLFLDAGTKDEFALDIGARVLSKRLEELDVTHIHEEFDDGHFNISYRYNRAFKLISDNFGE